MPPTPKITPPTEPEQLELDARSFNSAERLECQVQFDTAFGDLLRHIYEAIDPRREGLMTTAIITRDERRWFPDQVVQFMLWVQAKRTRPDAQLSEFDALTLDDLTSAHIAGLLGNRTARSTKRTRSSSGPASVDSSAA